MQELGTKLEMTSFWHVTVPSLGRQPSFPLIPPVLSCIPLPAQGRIVGGRYSDLT